MGKLNRCWVLLVTSLLLELEDKEEKLKKPFGRAEFRRTSIDGERDNPFWNDEEDVKTPKLGLAENNGRNGVVLHKKSAAFEVWINRILEPNQIRTKPESENLNLVQIKKKH